MKVLHAIASAESSYGGPVSALKGLVAGLKALGVDQSILTCSTGSKSKDEENRQKFKGIEVIFSYPLIKRYYWSPFMSSRMKEVLGSFDIVHVHGMFNGLVRSVCRQSRKMKILYVIRPFGTLSSHCLRISGFKKQLSLLCGEKKSIEHASAIHFTTNAERSRAEANFNFGHNFVSPNGIDFKTFGVDALGDVVCDNLCAEGDPVFLFLGRVHPIKGLEVFIPAFIKWAKTQETMDPRFMVVGPGEERYKDNLRDIVKKMGGDHLVSILPPVYGRDKVKVISCADIVVLPSYHENFGISVVEGMACSKPVMVSDRVDLSREIEKFDMGKVFSIDKEDIHGKLDDISDCRDEWEQTGKRGADWVRENCNWTIIAQKILDEYRKILNVEQK